MSNLIFISTPICPSFTTTKSLVGNKFSLQAVKRARISRSRGDIRAFFFNPSDEPILKEAIKEPVAFMGGIFAGLLRLDLNEEPLKEWINKTVEASSITQQEINIQGPDAEAAAPQQIDIE